ncbi:hypothetical protein AAF712_016301 [Marasmius tenuissimus]|uniref:Glycoside hydrolase family 76 protein n=1 Tax=Marasmius tenuissimus TaxID=585030 RepID=A0ABR2Z728_9AGAR
MLSLPSRFQSILIFLLVAFARDVYSQTLPSTTSFRKPEIILSSEVLRNLSAEAIDRVVQTDSFFLTPGPLPSISWPYGDLLAEMAQFDLFTSQAKYKDIVRDFYLNALQNLSPAHEYVLSPFSLYSTVHHLRYARTRNQLVYGYAALLAHLAYGDEALLTIAEKSWNSGLSFTLTDSDITAGSSGVKNFSLASICPNGATLVGGTFSLTDDENNPALNAATTGDFLILSAALSNATSNKTYLELAQKSADFVQRHITPISLTIWIHHSWPVHPFISDPEHISFLAGGSWKHDFKFDLAPAWSNSDDGGEPKVHLMRGYTELYRANTTPSDLKSYLGSYISTQFNAVVDLATSGGSNIYGSQYNGPAGVQFNNDSQAGAVAALLGGLAVGGKKAFTAPSPGPPDAGSEPRSKSSSVGAIVGGVISGIALAGILAASLWVYRRRARTKSRDHEIAAPYAVTTPSFTTAPSFGGEYRPSLLETSTVSGRGYPTSDSGATSTSGIMSPTTEELVLVLNQRLRNEGRWDPNELPPEYNTQVERSTLQREKRAIG